MNMAGLGGWRGLSRALKCFGVRGFLRARRQDLSLARCMAHNLARARKSESIRARIWYPGGYPGIPEDTRIREPHSSCGGVRVHELSMWLGLSALALLGAEQRSICTPLGTLALRGLLPSERGLLSRPAPNQTPRLWISPLPVTGTGGIGLPEARPVLVFSQVIGPTASVVVFDSDLLTPTLPAASSRCSIRRS